MVVKIFLPGFEKDGVDWGRAENRASVYDWGMVGFFLLNDYSMCVIVFLGLWGRCIFC